MLGCGECNRQFKSGKAYQQHLRDSPAHIEQFHCEQCDRTFGGAEALQQHINTSPAHQLRFECQYCNRSFSDQVALEQHLEHSEAHQHDHTLLLLHQDSTSNHERVSPVDVFFAAFPSFNYNPTKAPSDEWARLQRSMRWRTGDEACEDARTRYRSALMMEFEAWYGRGENSLKAWHTLCRALKIEPLPPSRTACRKAMRSKHVNIIDLIQCQRNGQESVRVFSNLMGLRQYTKDTQRYFPKASLEKGAALKGLLRELRRG